MNYQQVEEKIKAQYRQVADQYRRDDEIEVRTETHRRLGQRLRALSASFGRPITVLDAGCGTGRYFHCLENVAHLTGVDVSEEMLVAAADPVQAHELTAREIKLLCANIFGVTFPNSSFDLIYSLGMFGHGCPLTVEICDRFHDWLKPGGKLFFSVVDFAALPWASRVRRQARRMVYPLLPARLQRVLDRREKHGPFFGLTRRQLVAILRRTQLKTLDVSVRVCQSPIWSGRQLECLSSKLSAATPGL